MFLLDTDAEDVGIPPSALIDREFGDRQDAFRRRVQDSGLTTQSFASPAALGQLVERSLRGLAETRRRIGSSSEPAAEGGNIFVSYRRQESSHAGRLSDRLADRFGEDRVFIDVRYDRAGRGLARGDLPGGGGLPGAAGGHRPGLADRTRRAGRPTA